MYLLQPEIKKENKHVQKNTESNKGRFGKGIKEIVSPWEARYNIPGNFVYLTKSLYLLLKKTTK